MTQPTVEILGVYQLGVTDELVREQSGILYGQPKSPSDQIDAERVCREQLESVVLIEALVANRDSRFRVDDFAQAIPGQAKDNWQVAWAEAFLASDGETLLIERWSSTPENDPLRVAFFIHFWNPLQPLQSSYGELKCPSPKRMPERLQRLVPYEPLD